MNILIFSQDNFELSTEIVMDYILNEGNSVYRLNGSVLNYNGNNLISYDSIENEWYLSDKKLSKFDTFWYRRFSGKYQQDIFSKVIENKNQFALYKDIVDNLDYELNSVLVFIMSKFIKENKKYLTSFNQINVNKLMVLNVAESVQLSIPKFILTNSKFELSKFYNKCKKIITKDINASFSYYSEKEYCMLYTELVTKKCIENLDDFFMLSFFQEYIEKDYEVRIFFLDGNFYSMAIFSQSDAKTKIDFRHYNRKIPNRTVPYRLPSDLEQKLLNLIEKLNLKTGSIDMVVDKEGSHYFLEVNPVGQFGMVSYACNYFIEREIANYLQNV